MSELGSYIDADPGLSTTETAGTKRIGNLIRSLKWSVFQIDRYLLEEADKEVKKLKEQGKKTSLHLEWKCDRKTREIRVVL